MGSKNAMFQEKGGGFVKICSNSLDSTYLGGQIWDKIPQNPCLGGEFCILTKMCLGVYFKTFVHACVYLHIWVSGPPGNNCDLAYEEAISSVNKNWKIDVNYKIILQTFNSQINFWNQISIPEMAV